MKPVKIILLRHGESEANVNKGIYEHQPDHFIPLTEKGRLQCIERGTSFKNILDGKRITLWRSPYTRSRETADLVLSQVENAEVKTKEDPRLREQDWGNFYTQDEALKRREERKRHSQFFYRLENGESGADVYDRVSTFLETLHRDFDRDNWTEVILISTHGLTALVFLMRFFHWSYEEFERSPWFANCDYVVLALNELTQRYEISHDHRSSIKY